jgi:hypothetical protein
MNVIRASVSVYHYTLIMNSVSKFASPYSTLLNASLDGNVHVGGCHVKLSLNPVNTIYPLMEKFYSLEIIRR